MSDFAILLGGLSSQSRFVHAKRAVKGKAAERAVLSVFRGE